MIHGRLVAPLAAMLAGLLAGCLLPVTASSAEAMTASTTIRIAHREFGDGPVVVGRDERRVAIVFHGRAGQWVDLRRTVCTPVLREAGRGVVEHVPEGYWQLPRTATYRFDYVHCGAERGVETTLQLIRIVARTVRVDGDPVRLRHQKAFDHAVAIRVPAKGQVLVQPNHNHVWRAIVKPDGSRLSIDGQSALMLRPGRPITDAGGLPVTDWGGRRVVAHAGERLLLVGAKATRVRAQRVPFVTAAVDGPAVTIDNQERPARLAFVEFQGRAGNWVGVVHSASAGSTSLDLPLRLHRPHGVEVTRSFGPLDYWQLPVSGRYRLIVPIPADASSSVRLQSIAEVGTLPSDGTPKTFVVQDPGQWQLATVVVPADGPPGAYTLQAGTSSLGGEWRALLEVGHRYVCSIYAPPGCSENTYQLVGPAGAAGGWSPVRSWIGDRRLVVLLATPPGQTGAVDLSVQPSPPSSTAISQRAPREQVSLPASSRTQTLNVHRRYGQGAVIVPRGVDRVRISFHGRKGDLVRLDEAVHQPDSCGAVSLRGPSGTVDAWVHDARRLPVTGRYSFVFTRCLTVSRYRLQLVKIRLRDLPVNGAPVVVRRPRNAAYAEWASVVVPQRGRVQVRPTTRASEGPWYELYLRGAPALNVMYWHQEAEQMPQAIYLEAGAPIANELGMMMPAPDEPLVPRAGQRVVLVPGEAKVRARASRALMAPGTLDGAAVPVSALLPFQEVGVRFYSEGDQWVTASPTRDLTARLMRSLALVGPDGTTLVGLAQARPGKGGRNLWHLPTAGRYRLMVRTDPGHASGRIRLSTVRELGTPMPTDGQPLAVTTERRGEWVVVNGQLADTPYTLSAQAAGATDWAVDANALPFVLCRSSFCADETRGTAGPNGSYFPQQHAVGPWIFLVAFRPSQSGTVTLRLTPSG